MDKGKDAKVMRKKLTALLLACLLLASPMSAAYAGLPVHVFGSDAGVCAAFNGGTHMPLEDAAMYMAIPHAVVTDPCDYAQLASVTRQTADCDCVTYTRFVRKDIVQVYGDDSVFQLGKGVVLRESNCDAVTVIASGIMVDEALKAVRVFGEGFAEVVTGK